MNVRSIGWVLITVAACDPSNPDGAAVVDVGAQLRATDLRIAIGALAASGCFGAEIAADLRRALGTGKAGDVGALAKRIHNPLICEGGQRLLGAAIDGLTPPLFERGRVVFDETSDGCPESVLALDSRAIRRLDADGDGCMDRFWDLPASRWFRGLSPAVKAELEQLAVDLGRAMFPPHVLDDQATAAQTAAWKESRPLALAKLDQLLAHVEASEAIAPEAKGGLTAFLQNTRPFVEEYVGCTNGGTAGEAKLPAACAGGAKCQPARFRFCVYTDGDHAWKGLEIDGKDHQRGLYPVNGLGVLLPVPRRGIIHDDSDRRWTHRICYDLTAEEAQALKDAINGEIDFPPLYGFYDHYLDYLDRNDPPRNCMGWAAGNAARIGRRLPGYTTLGVPDPEALQDSLEDLASAGGAGPGDRVERNPQ
jgi:hypothetical protein